MPVDLNSINPALLQFCLKHHDDERFQELQQDRDPSDYEWLKNVLEAMAGESSGHAIERMLEQIDKQPPISDSELVLILEELQQIAEQFDNAIHMARVGSERILKLLSHKCDDVRYHTLHIIATCSLHNKAACLSMIEAGALAKVIELMNNAANEVERVRSKIVTALSALTSTASVSRQFFLKSRQFPAFRQLLLSSEKAATRSKIFFFGNKLARNEPIARHAFSQPQTGLLEPAAAALSESGIENMSMRSNAATLLVTLLDPPPLPEPDTPPLLLAAPPSSATTTTGAAAPSPLPSNDTAAAPAITDTLEQLHLRGIVDALLSDIEQSGDDARSDELAVVKQLRTLLSASQ